MTLYLDDEFVPADMHVATAFPVSAAVKAEVPLTGGRGWCGDVARGGDGCMYGPSRPV